MTKEELMEKTIDELEILDNEYFRMWTLIRTVKKFKKS